MSPKGDLKELPQDQKKVAETLLRNFLITLGMAFFAEVFLRLFPTILPDVPESRWLEWLLVSLIGVSAYLIWNIANWYRIPSAQFKEHRPWYRATAARGPILALVILIALTNISFQVELPAAAQAQPAPAEEDSGPVQAEETPDEAAPAEDTRAQASQPPTFEFGVDFGQANDAVLLVAAFLLGFYSRLAKSVLGRITKFIFGGVFEETYEEEEKFRKMLKEEKLKKLEADNKDSEK